MSHVFLGIAKAVLDSETHEKRFERFCCDLVAIVEGDATIVTTSASWDVGRDGRSIAGKQRVIVCATTTPRLGEKFPADIRRNIESGIRIDRIYFCVSLTSISEHTLDGLARDLRAELPNLPESVAIDPLSGYQLAQLCEKHPAPIRKHYRTELEDIHRSILADDNSGDSTREALLLALASAGHENSNAIRAACYRTVLLRCLDDRLLTLNDISVRVKNDLSLARAVPNSVILSNLSALIGTGEVARENDRWKRTEVGASAAAEDVVGASTKLLQGRTAVRNTLESSLGFTFTDQQFVSIWSSIEKSLANLFHTSGFRIVELVGSIVKSDPISARSASSDLPFFVDEIATSAATAAGPQLGNEVVSAVRGIFAERTSVAYQWMTDVCASFMMVCTLGLEASSGAEIRNALSQARLVFDTDVVLDLLGVEEQEHHSALSLARHWRTLGGQLLLALPVAEEVAYHAHIALRDLENGRDFIWKRDLRSVYLKNVFARTFGGYLESGKLRLSDWNRWIDGYRGATPYDAANVREALVDEYGFTDLADCSLGGGVAARAFSHFEQRIDATTPSPEERRIKIDKARRDARLFGSIAAQGEAARNAGRAGSILLVTSSGRLQEMNDDLHASGASVLSLAEAVCLLTMVPGVSISLPSLQAILFDGRLSTRRSDVDLLILRTIHDAGYSLPDARRPALLRNVRAALVQRAKESGDSVLLPQNVAGAASTNSDVQKTLATTIAAEIDALGGETRLERENADLKRKIAQLEAQLNKGARRS